MSSSTPYFHAQALRARFVQNLDHALHHGDISDQEHQWLLAVANAGTSDPGRAPRIDRLLTDEGSPVSDEMVAALLISHPEPGDTPVYLHTLLHGLQRFEDRTALLAALGSLFSADRGVLPVLEYQLYQAPLFEQQMLTVVDQRARHLAELAERLQQVPAWQDALALTLQQQLASALPGISLDPVTHSLHILQDDPAVPGESAGASIVAVQTLLRAAVDQCLGVKLPAGRRRVFLGARGQILDVTESQPWQQALDETVKNFKWGYEAQLGDYWRSARPGQQSSRDLAATALARGFRQELLRRREDGSLAADEFRDLAAALQQPEQFATPARPLRFRKLSVAMGDQEPLKLAGIFVVQFLDVPTLWLYSSTSGLRRFASQDALRDYLADPAQHGEVLRHLSLNDHRLFNLAQPQPQPLHLRLDEIERGLFLDRIDSIIGLQQRNLSFALDQPRIDAAGLGAMIDDALDVRHLIDPRLLRVNPAARWSENPAGFAQRWLSTPVSPPPSTHDHAEDDDSWSSLVTALDSRMQGLLNVRPELESSARQALDLYLAVLCDTPVDALDIEVQPPVALNPAPASRSLLALLLERCSGYSDQPVPGDSLIVQRSTTYVTPEPVAQLTPLLINHLLSRAAADLFSGYLRQVQRFNGKPFREGGVQMQPGTLSWVIREQLLRLEYGIQERIEVLDRQRLQMCEQVINRPLRDLRLSLGDAITEVYTLSLVHDSLGAAIALTNTFILRQPAVEGSGLVFWSAFKGLQAMDSLPALELKLNVWLVSPDTREKWLSLLCERDQSLLRSYLEQPQHPLLRLTLNRVDGHFIQALQQAEQVRRYRNVEWAWADARHCRLKAAGFSRLVDLAVSDDRTRTVLDVVSLGLQNLLLQSMLPSWLVDASNRELAAYLELMQRYYLANQDREDFLAGIPLLDAFAREQLRTQLKQDFAGHTLDPDSIWVNLTRYVAAPAVPGEIPSAIPAATHVDSETLSDYALNHFSTIRGAHLSLSFSQGMTPVPGFTSSYVESLVRTLDIGARYRELITRKLSPDSPDFAQRRKRFIEQMPSRMLMAAFDLQLQKQLSPKAYDFVENVINMPDGLAREPVHGQDITLRAMRLVAQPGMTPDTVPGVYLIGPRDISQGPVVLHALLNDDFIFKEYASQAALMEELQAIGPLQTLVLARLDELRQRRYAHGGFIEAHVPWSTEGLQSVPLGSPGPVTLENHPEQGNVIQFLFQQTLDVLIGISKTQTVTTAEVDWLSFVHLMTLGVEQALSFMPGKLGQLVAAWQSQALFKASAASVHDRNWGQAFSEFSAAVGMLVTARKADDETRVEERSRGAGIQENQSPPGFSWRGNALTPELKDRLRAFEVHDVALNTLQKDELFNLYQNLETQQVFAPVEGQVYQVRNDQGRWRIVGELGEGPWLASNEHQQWALDLASGLLGGGGVSTRFAAATTTAEVENIFNVLASGMPDIRAAYLDKAMMIAQARQQALVYLRNCLHNLNPVTPGTALDGRAAREIGTFFGVQVPSTSLLGVIKQMVEELLVALTDPSLAPAFSRRFVVGTNKPGNESTIGFVVKADPRQRIYLTERFFENRPFLLKTLGVGQGSFNPGTHFRAATLIHEVSHLANDTHDIAYLESGAPFNDLLDDSNVDTAQLKLALQMIQSHSLSHRSRARDLFQKYGASGLRDLKSRDGAGKDAILRITGQPTLDKARQVFLTVPERRAEVILNNADSVTLLITLLGRQRWLNTQV
jgi:hypothetical protein